MFNKWVVAWLPTIEVRPANEAGDIVDAIGRRAIVKASLGELRINQLMFELECQMQADLFCGEEVVRPCHRVAPSSPLDRRRAPLREMVLGDEAFDPASKRVDAFRRHCSHIDAKLGANGSRWARLLGG